MLTKIDEEEILKLRSLKFSYQKIQEETKKSIYVIAKVCKKYKNNTIQNQDIGLDLSDYKDSIDKLRKIEFDLSNLVDSGKLKSKDQKLWEKRLVDIREIIRVDVDERKAEETKKIIMKKDEEFNREIQDNYIKKTIANKLENIIKEKDKIIENQSNQNELYNKKLNETEKQYSKLIFKRENDIRKLKEQNIEINEKNKILYDENLNLKENIYEIQNKLNSEKNDFFRHIEKEQLNIINSKSKLEKQIISIEIREKILEQKEKEIEEQENKIKKDREFLIRDMRKNNSQKKKDNAQYLKKLENIKNIDEQQRIKSERLEELERYLEKNVDNTHFSLPCPNCKKPMIFDPSDSEIYEKLKICFKEYTHAECSSKKNKPQKVRLYPIS